MTFEKRLRELERELCTGSWFERKAKSLQLEVLLFNNAPEIADLVEAARGVFDEHGDATSENNAWEDLRDALAALDKGEG